jgi:hypothetical protein
VNEVRLPGRHFGSISSAVLVQVKGAVAAVVPAVDEGLDGGDQVGTEVKLPRRIACRVMIEKNTSTRFSHDPDVGVKCSVIRGCLSSQPKSFSASEVWLLIVLAPGFRA